MSDFEAMVEAYAQAGGDPGVLASPTVASLVVSGNRVLGAREVPGIEFASEELPQGVKATIRVLPRARLASPVHLCFGVLPTHGVQEILAAYEIGEDANVTFLAHCTFPNATAVRHVMDATVHVGRGAAMRYTEAHFHGPTGGVEVLPTARVVVDEGGRFLTTFTLVQGRAGKVGLDYAVDVAETGVADLTTRIMGSGQDLIRVEDAGNDGAGSGGRWRDSDGRAVGGRPASGIGPSCGTGRRGASASEADVDPGLFTRSPGHPRRVPPGCPLPYPTQRGPGTWERGTFSDPLSPVRGEGWGEGAFRRARGVHE